MNLIIATISIFAIAVLVWWSNRILPFRICPICAGVSGTWLWMLIGIFLGLLPTTHYQLLTALLMGGSVVGIAYQLEKKLTAGKSPVLWKTTFIPVGFAAVYSILTQWWVVFIAAATLLIALMLKFVALPRAMRENEELERAPHKMRREELEKKMKDCC